MGTADRPAKTSPGSWDAFVAVDVFVDEVLAELDAMAKDGSRPMRSGPKPPLAAALRKGDGDLVCLFLWHAVAGDRTAMRYPLRHALQTIRPLDGLSLWRRMLDRLRRTWRRACGDSPEPSAVVIDSRSCRSAPSCFNRGIDGGKKIRGVKIP
jgi:hypothetical protein